MGSSLFLCDYEGRFPDHPGPNCFASALAMAMVQNPSRSATGESIIQMWLHQGPFFRLLDAQGYEKARLIHGPDDLDSAQASDLWVWNASDGSAVHAAYIVSDGLAFNKRGQGWHQPWHVLRVEDVSYNNIFSDGGRISVYRK